MELAIPFIALGGLYVVSNNQATRPPQKSTQSQMRSSPQQEAFSGLSSRINNSLPNTYDVPDNYPIARAPALANNVHAYATPNDASNDYFNQNDYKVATMSGDTSMGQTIPQTRTLTGEAANQTNYHHNNMVPFTGGKIYAQRNMEGAGDSILDNMVGAGSNFVRKTEQAPLFKPEANMHWAHGAPSQSDFMQSRVVAGKSQNNTKPFESERVAPGLNQGFTTTSSGTGFHYGGNDRSSYMPKTVDELRSVTNPKMTYDISSHQGPANSTIKTAASMQTMGRVEKRRPDTHFENTQDRWLTTTGANQGNTLHAIQEQGIVRRCDGPTNYVGTAVTTDQKSGYAPANYHPSHRRERANTSVPTISAVGRGPLTEGLNGYAASTKPQARPQPGGIARGFAAAMAPIMDLIRPTRKEETIANARIYGDNGLAGTAAAFSDHSLDHAPTTIKETTLYTPNLTVNRTPQEGAYVANERAPNPTQRDSTACGYIGGAGNGGHQEAQSREAAHNQHNNTMKSALIDNRAPGGGTQIFNQSMNVTTTKRDRTRYDGRMNPIQQRGPGSIPSVETYGHTNVTQLNPNSGIMDTRNEPSILDAFKNNPYTHSLSSVA